MKTHCLWIYEVISECIYFFINIWHRIRNQHLLIGLNAHVNIHSVFEGFNKIEKNSIFAGHLGRCSYIGANSLVVGKIGRYCSIGGNVFFLTSTHPTKLWISTHPAFFSARKQCGISFVSSSIFDESPKLQDSQYSIEIGNDVYIGFGVILIGPLRVGNGAIIGAGSVVTKDVPPYAIVAGNPARIIRYRFSPEVISKIENTEWWNYSKKFLSDNAQCFQTIELFDQISFK